MNQKSQLRKLLLRWVLPALILLAMAMFFASAVLEHFNRTPRELAPYVERRVSGHNALIVSTGNWVGKTLRVLDRMEPVSYQLPALNVGAQIVAKLAPSEHLVMVGSEEQAILAIHNAKPGDVITFLPGVYRFSNGNINVKNPGREDAPIIVRAQQAGSVKLELWLGEGFIVSAPFWIFENLHVRGICKMQEFCEHAFHVVGNAHHFIARNNTILDFNAHFKVNMEQGKAPDDGELDHNTLSNSEPRHTSHPVTVIDLVAASRWRIHHNLISDFIKDGGDRISYGGFVKGAGADNRIEQNLVICEHRLGVHPGQRVGLSLGDGGTGLDYCRDHRCITEQDRGVLDSNLVMSCSDDGIYLNKAAASRVTNNTLIDTGGMEVRFPESSADVEGNLVDGKIRARDGGLLRTRDNLETSLTSIFAGYHPVRARFRDPAMLDLTWQNKPGGLPRATSGSFDLCGVKRTEQSPAGAFDDFIACLQRGDKVPAK